MTDISTSGPVKVHLDVAILGGGVAGLWLLNLLHREGYSAFLFERAKLGGGQTLAAQGIIHAGKKYGFGLVTGDDASALKRMPSLWRECLAGNGEVDLRAAKVASPNQHFWVRRSLIGAITGKLGSLAVREHASQVSADEWPEALKSSDSAVGGVYSMDEPVLDTPSLVRALARPLVEQIGKIDWPDGWRAEVEPDGTVSSVMLRHPAGHDVQLTAKAYVVTAGAGNQRILDALARRGVEARLRPLHQLMIKGRLPPLWAHCLDAGDVLGRPLATITTHHMSDGTPVWYIGGTIAENGVNQTPDQLIAEAKQLMPKILPGIDFKSMKWATQRVDRAERASPGGRPARRPEVVEIANVMVAWPTKLALTPMLAGELLDRIRKRFVEPTRCDLSALGGWTFPGFGQTPWDTANWE